MRSLVTSDGSCCVAPYVTLCRMIAHRIRWTAKRNSLRNAKLVPSQWTLFVSFVANYNHNYSASPQIHQTKLIFRSRCDSFYIHQSGIQCFELTLKYELTLPGIKVLTSWSAFMCAKYRHHSNRSRLRARGFYRSDDRMMISIRLETCAITIIARHRNARTAKLQKIDLAIVDSPSLSFLPTPPTVALCVVLGHL